MFCTNCGKKIHPSHKFCDGCGAPQRETAPAWSADQTPYNIMCILGLVISGISLLLNFWRIVGITGTIISVLGLLQCGRKQERGKSLAIAGIAIGVYSIIYGVIALIGWSAYQSSDFDVILELIDYLMNL